MMLTSTRIYTSVPRDSWLEPDQLDVKRGIFERLKSVGFEPHEFLLSGDLSHLAWSHKNLQYILGRCQGVLILGFVRWNVWDAQSNYKFNTAYNHYEGALARAKDLPTFILMHEHIFKAGIAIKGKAEHYVKLPDKVDSSWLETDPFLSKFNRWVEAVKARHHVFFAYSSTAKVTANKIIDFLVSKGVSVLDRAVDFNQAPGIIEIERVSKNCMGGIFLFTREDEGLADKGKSAFMRDQIIFETGYFLHAKGVDKTLIIREDGASIPAGIDNIECFSFQNRADISPIERDLEKFIVENL